MSPRIDLTHQRFEELTVQEWLPGLRLSRSSLTWLCRCDCGQTVPISRDALRGGHARRCPACQATRNEQASQKRATMQRERLNAEPPSLEQRIAEALRHKRVTSEALSAVFDQAADALVDVEQQVADTQARVLDPTNLDPDTRTALDDAIWRRDKLQAAVQALRTKHQQVMAEERKVAWNHAADAIEARRDDLTEVFASTYPELVAQLIELFQRVKSMDQEVDRINGAAPNSESRRLLPVGVRGEIAAKTSLLGLSGQVVFPPPAPPLALQMAMPVVPHPGSHWFEAIQQRDQERHVEAQRVAAYYQNQQEQREKAEAAKARRGNGASP